MCQKTLCIKHKNLIIKPILFSLKSINILKIPQANLLVHSFCHLKMIQQNNVKVKIKENISSLSKI